MRIYRILERTGVAGPGQRFCLWVQGCSRRCEGCVMEGAMGFNGGFELDTEVLFHQISSINNIEGVTFLGGEPLEQADEVGKLAERVQSAGLSVLVFTGFTYEELLTSGDVSVSRLLGATDLLIDGPFIKEKFDLSRPWAGSSNQQYRFLSGRYTEKDITGEPNRIEVRIGTDGKTMVNGMGNFDLIKSMFKRM